MIETPFADFGRRPAPFVEVNLMGIWAGQSLAVPAQLDTGADRSIIPRWVAEQLQLVETDTITHEAVDGAFGTLSVYRLILRIRTFRPIFLSVAASQHEPHVLLDRDFSNRYRILLDGPARQLRIEE